jgi:hypothetical protein
MYHQQRTELYREPDPNVYYNHYRLDQLGKGYPIFTGQHQHNQQSGRGIGSLFRGVSSLISKVPSWLLSTAGSVAKNVVSGISEHKADVAAGADKQKSKKRQFKKALGNILAEGAATLHKGMGRRRRRKRKQKLSGKQKKFQKGKGIKIRMRTSAKIVNRKKQAKKHLARKSRSRRRRRRITRTKQDIFQ